MQDSEPDAEAGAAEASLSPSDLIIPPLREWRWPLPRWYNGFSPQERVRGGQAIWWLVDSGRIPPPNLCSITGVRTGEPCHRLASTSSNTDTTAVARLHYHSENYYDPFEVFPICTEAHRLFHRRFYDPGPWQNLVAHYSRTGDEWFARLKPYRIDLAAELRHKHGPAVTDVLATATAGSAA